MTPKTCASPSCHVEITKGNYCKSCIKKRINEIENTTIKPICARDHDEETDRELEDMENLVLFPGTDH